MRKPNSIIVLLYSFHIIHPQKQKPSVEPFCFWGEHSKGLSNQADVELDMINAISAADIVFIMSSSQVLVNWLNALDQSEFSQWVWCIIISFDKSSLYELNMNFFACTWKKVALVRFSGAKFPYIKDTWTMNSWLFCTLFNLVTIEQGILVPV